ncbi:MAG: DUF1190 domain-containing protein [Hyphomicrobiaceae bacterium]|nr:DUF1190 domain-containing protein [Hyphomicrobiaceae bacterium]
MKRSRYVALLGMGVSALTLTACEDPNEIVPVKAYATVSECVADGFSKATCDRSKGAAEDAYDSAYPKYQDQAECEDVAGTGRCELDKPSSRDASWRPSMIGFIMAGARAQPQAVVSSATSPTGRATASGVVIAGRGGASSIPARAAAAPTASQITKGHTMARGGFGSTATRVSASGFGGTSAHTGG